MITNLSDLRAVVTDEYNNSALATRFATFLDAVHVEISRWALATDLAALVEDADTNDVLTQYPDAYRYGCLARGCAFARDYDAAQIYEAQFQRQLQRIADSPLALASGLAPSPSTLNQRTP